MYWNHHYTIYFPALLSHSSFENGHFYDTLLSNKFNIFHERSCTEQGRLDLIPSTILFVFLIAMPEKLHLLFASPYLNMLKNNAGNFAKKSFKSASIINWTVPKTANLKLLSFENFNLLCILIGIHIFVNKIYRKISNCIKYYFQQLYFQNNI